MTMSASYQDDGPSSGDEAPVVQRKKIGGRQPGATNYSVEEVQCLLDLIKRIKPSTAAQWDNLAGEYNKLQQFNPRTGENLNKKFQSLLKKKKFNENQQEVSSEVQQARAIHLAMRSSNINMDFNNDPSASDFSVPEDVVHSTNVPAAVSVNTEQIRAKPPVMPGGPSTTKVVATLTDVTSALQHVFDQNKGTVGSSSDNATIIGMLEEISNNVKLILSEVVKMNEHANHSRSRENDSSDEKASKQPRHH